jgi:hypothetical protein
LSHGRFVGIQEERFLSLETMQGIGIDITVHTNRIETQFMGCTIDSNGNFSSIDAHHCGHLFGFSGCGREISGEDVRLDEGRETLLSQFGRNFKLVSFYRIA